MNNPSIYIHTGLSKCASTFLQKTIFPQLGNYSDIAFAPEKEKYYIFRSNIEKETYLSYVHKHLVNPMENQRHLIISCEDYSELVFRGFEDVFFQWQMLDRSKYQYSNKVITRNLAFVYPNARIIFIIREQFDWAISRHKMNYRGGKSTADINHYLQEPLEGYDETIQRYFDYFGRENVLVLPYEMLLVNQTDFIHSICRFINPEFSIKMPAKRINEGPELLRIVEYERHKNKKRLAIKNNGKASSPFTSIRLIGSRLVTGLVKPLFAMKYGNHKYEVEVSETTRRILTPRLIETNRRVEKLTGIDLAQYGYIT